MERREGLYDRRRDAIDPLGHVLRATYDAENHASLDGPTTALMLELARLPSPEERPAERRPAAPSLLGRMRRLIGR